MTHVQHRSLEVRPGDNVRIADVVAMCGNSGNSTEPHPHIQVIDRPSTWMASGIAFTIDGQPLPGDGDHLVIGTTEPTAPTEGVGHG